MSKILYAGQLIALPDNADVDGLAEMILDSYGKGGHSWVTFEAPDNSRVQVRILLGPGIPVAFLEDGDEPGSAQLSGQ